MEILVACIAGFLCGWFSVTAVIVLYERMMHKAEPKEPEAKEREEPGHELSPEEKRWMEEIEALWNYDGKGGAMSGDKENS